MNLKLLSNKYSSCCDTENFSILGKNISNLKHLDVLYNFKLLQNVLFRIASDQYVQKSVMACRSRYKDVQWRTIEGAFAKPKRLHLVSDPRCVFQCPIRNCDHIGFKSQRGCRKHVKKVHGWYIYFDSKPNISTTDKGIYSDEEQQPSRLIKICHLIQKNIPSEYSSLSGSKVQEVEEEQQVKLNRTPQEHSSF